MTPEWTTMANTCLNVRVAAEYRVEDGVGEARDDQGQERQRDDLAADGEVLAVPAICSIRGYCASVMVRPNDSIWRTCLSSPPAGRLRWT